MKSANEHHESAPWTRFALVVLLGMAALMGMYSPSKRSAPPRRRWPTRLVSS